MGENDEVTPPEVAAEFHEMLSNSRLHFIPDCGHVPMVEHPAVFNELTEAFLTGLSGSGSPELSEPACLPVNA